MVFTKILMLTFSVTRIVLGEIEEIDLIPRGREIDVNSKNKIEYIYKAADYYTRRSIQQQIEHFIHGFFSIVDKKYFFLF